ncbi:tyrosine-type recombinase/integrase [Lentzea tibetensis]|uniref:Tyrosine-type recombinase/integrase n=1 Tax=Lentzea tibetensis TaxID=2591470 RepID=A0A563EEP1_9PSEU|nr:tyrosine-type recombinase/integrase [Lentzea tibetensis]
MSVLRAALEDYLRLRRSPGGHQMAEAAWQLPDFVDFLEDRGQRTVTIQATLAWIQHRQGKQVTTMAPRRMTAVRGFARYLSGIDPDTEVPPLGLLPHRQRWRQPFIYSDADIAAVLTAATAMDTRLRAATYHTLIGLLAASGMRIGEAINLDRDDIDWTEGVLRIRPHDPRDRATRPLSTDRHSPRVPQHPVTMPKPAPLTTATATCSGTMFGIVPESA